MATNPDEMTERARAGWNGFSRFIGLSTVAILATLGLMALFLL